MPFDAPLCCRCLDAGCGNTVLSGLFLHTVRKPSSQTLLAAGGIRVKSDDVAQICAASRFPLLLSACVNDNGAPGNSSLVGTQLGGIGSDPVFSK